MPRRIQRRSYSTRNGRLARRFNTRERLPKGAYCNLRVMHIGFDISQTGALKAGCGYYAHAMVQALLEVAPLNRYSLYPSFGDYYFDAGVSRSHEETSVGYSPRHETIQQAAAFW